MYDDVSWFYVSLHVLIRKFIENLIVFDYFIAFVFV